MPKVVDHAARRRELAAAVWRVLARDGVAEVSIRTVAAESGWSSGALRHYFATRAELLAFACEEVIATVTHRLENLRPEGTVREAAEALLRETMPLDERRHLEASIAFAFLALGLGDPELARVQRLHFSGMAGFCRELAGHLLPAGADLERAGRRLHAVVDGLTVHVLAGHLTPDEAAAELSAYLDDLVPG
ncbi:TetR/AcrR family transcriptional regulator [Couchioplanes azureus]|uniref:TetR/AcrR family transcriptional regulator n=1 Tax=Couchioplanes caeruleus TaxID=56438 RepID=UPI00166F6A9C|nr:TetR/AcrR family transcriptional regulator [Couchioplanes caeruleus]GGQ59172.1 transcriptional regulator [Couchioplanes caeruleus subsp. azureus]